VKRVDRCNLRFAQALVAALAGGTAQGIDTEFRLAADGILHQPVFRAVGLVASRQHGLGHEFDLRRAYPAVAHGRQSRLGPGMLQADPVDHGHARENPVEIVGVALRHGQPFAAAFRRSHEIQLGRRIAVGAHHHRHRCIPHLLV